MNKQTIKSVKVSATGVQFGNCWLSHEQITGYTADQLNSGDCDVIGGQYVAWLSAEETAPVFDEAKERELFESRWGFTNEEQEIYFIPELNCYGSNRVNSAADSKSSAWYWWKACAKSRAGVQS